MRKSSILSFAIVFCTLGTIQAKEDVRTITVDLFKVEKNLEQSYVGYDAEDFACRFNFNWMLTTGRRDFAKYCQQAGVRCLRFAEMSRYSWRGELPTRLMRARTMAHSYPKIKGLYQKLAAKKLDWWFKPELFWSFCRENRIVVLPMFNAVSYYNPEKKQAYCIVNRPEHYVAAAKEAATYVKWLKDNGFLDLAKLWEIGNECYLKGWKPQEYAAFVKILVKEVRQVQADIKLGIPTFICTRDNPDVKEVLRRMRAGTAQIKSRERSMYQQALTWSGGVIEALGNTAKHISYGIEHSYGAGSSYISNYKGIEVTAKLLDAFPNSRKWRLSNTEWRDRSGENPWCHRQFLIAALWKSKFVLTLMAYPRMDYTAAHSLMAFSGGLYWSNGQEWILQRNPVNQRLYDLNGNGKPRFDVGAFGPVVKMCNDLIDTHPEMLAHGADMGEMSSAKFYDTAYQGKGAPKLDLQWLISTNASRSSLRAVFVNTHKKAIKIKLTSSQGLIANGAAVIRTLQCEPGQELTLQIPGQGHNWNVRTYGMSPDLRQFWNVEIFKRSADTPLVLLPQSVSLVTLPVKLNQAVLKYRNRVRSDLPGSIRGFAISGDADISLQNGTVAVTGRGKGRALLLFPLKPPGKSDKTRNFTASFKVSADTPVKCVLLVADDKWNPAANQPIITKPGWQTVTKTFVLPAGRGIKLFRANIYNLTSGKKLFIKDVVFKMNQNQ
jgi:hypothetical protein